MGSTVTAPGRDAAKLPEAETDHVTAGEVLPQQRFENTPITTTQPSSS